jgi:hypothetical protein
VPVFDKSIIGLASGGRVPGNPPSMPLTMPTPGTWKVLRVDGTEETFEQRPHFRDIYKAIGCSSCDSVNLPQENGELIVMLCDDTGMLDHKPVNPKATELYHTRCMPGTVHAIHGDVALVVDSDFSD